MPHSWYLSFTYHFFPVFVVHLCPPLCPRRKTILFVLQAFYRWREVRFKILTKRLRINWSYLSSPLSEGKLRKGSSCQLKIFTNISMIFFLLFYVVTSQNTYCLYSLHCRLVLDSNIKPLLPAKTLTTRRNYRENLKFTKQLLLWFISVYESTSYLKFANLQYVSSGFRCRVIIGSLMRLY